VSDADTPRFQQSRKNWATAADDAAATVYCDYYDIDPSDIYAVESLVDDVHDLSGGYRTHQLLDYCSFDRFIDCTTHVYGVAQRWRPPDQHHDVDVPIRVENGHEDRVPELPKWKHAHRDGRGLLPDVLAFGVWEGTLEVFQSFHLIDVPAVLDALAAGALIGDRHPTGDGTAALYLPIDALDDAGCIVASREAVAANGGDSHE
jgi:hypothetical protein